MLYGNRSGRRSCKNLLQCPQVIGCDRKKRPRTLRKAILRHIVKGQGKIILTLPVLFPIKDEGCPTMGSFPILGLTVVDSPCIILLWNPPLYDSQRRCAVKRTVACHPARAEWRRVCSPRGKFFSKGVTYITLQEVYWIIGITWILYQVLKDFLNRKKWAVCCNRRLMVLWSYASRFRCSFMLVATVWVSITGRCLFAQASPCIFIIAPWRRVVKNGWRLLLSVR